MFTRATVIAVFAAAVVALLTASSTQAWSTRVNHLTFNTAVRLPGVVLTPGTYTFEAGPQGSDLDVVRVTTRRGDKVLFQGFTTDVSRSTGGSVVSFGEASAGVPQPIAVWYEDGATRGHQFRYR
ncbi:MAG: hypothetical protein ACRD3C_22295 [Vicinamibacterales bacterium]